MKGSFQFTTHIDKSIKVGDKVWLSNGSAVSCDTRENGQQIRLFINFKYRMLTGSDDKLRDMIGEVIEVDVKDRVFMGEDFACLQDIVIRLGTGIFRTPSKFVKKVE